MVGYWNIWTINGAIFDRLDAQVTNPANPQETPPPPVRPVGYRPDWLVIGPQPPCSVSVWLRLFWDFATGP